MSTLVVDNLNDGTSSGSTTDMINGSARAWVNFQGTSTVVIRSSYNVSSITDLGTGNYKVNFTNAMPDNDYVVSASCHKGDTNDDGNMMLGVGGSTSTYDTNQTVSSVIVWSLVGTSTVRQDTPVGMVAVFR